MGTGYAIVRDERYFNHDRAPEVIQVVWTEGEAVKYVNHLNSLALGDDHPYSWQPTWVARDSGGAGEALTPRDREYLDLARAHDALGTERPIAVFFSFTLNWPGALAASEELEALGWPEVGRVEDLTGDELWNVYGHRRRLMLIEETIVKLRVAMEDIAERHGGIYDGWDVSGSVGLRARPGELPT